MPRKKDHDRLERLKEHRSVLNRILKDVRFSPNRALLAEMLAIYFDVVRDEDRDMIRALLFSVFGDPKHIKWFDKEDPPSTETHLSRLDAHLTSQVKNVFGNLLPPKED